jgi:hypothetical protein
MASYNGPGLKLNVGKIRSTGTKYPWEPGYVASIKGQMKSLEDIIKALVTQVGDATPEIVMKALEPTFEKAKKYCPKDTHALADSAYLENVGFRGQPRVEMGFARGGIPYYGVIVHENLEFHHQAPTQAKFLERAVNEDIPDIAIRIADGYKDFMNG